MEQTMSSELLYITELITQQNEILATTYGTMLFAIGVTAAILVLFVLYKFIKVFY